METKKTKVVIDRNCDIVYSSPYIYGLCILFGKQVIGFGDLNLPQKSSDGMCFILTKGGKAMNYYVSLADSYKIDENKYDWCDVYGSVNANYAKTPERFHNKLVPLCPSFGIRCWNFPTALFHAIKGGGNIECSMKKYIGKFKRMLQRPEYQDYFTSPRLLNINNNHVFFLSTLWYSDEWNRNDEGVNARRANFIRACKELEDVNFEGGLVSQGKDRSSEGLFSDCLCGGIPMTEWMEKTKQSALVFNTPAFWDCHGWKLGEYLAMGKCIVSTKLSNDLPSPLEHGKNIHFVENDKDSMKEAVQYIVRHPDYRMRLEQGAQAYWEQYGSPIASLKLLGIER